MVRVIIKLRNRRTSKWAFHCRISINVSMVAAQITLLLQSAPIGSFLIYMLASAVSSERNGY